MYVLSNEILLEIFILLRASDTYRLQLVCSRFFQLIRRNKERMRLITEKAVNVNIGHRVRFSFVPTAPLLDKNGCYPVLNISITQAPSESLQPYPIGPGTCPLGDGLEMTKIRRNFWEVKAAREDLEWAEILIFDRLMDRFTFSEWQVYLGDCTALLKRIPPKCRNRLKSIKCQVIVGRPKPSDLDDETLLHLRFLDSLVFHKVVSTRLSLDGIRAVIDEWKAGLRQVKLLKLNVMEKGERGSEQVLEAIHDCGPFCNPLSHRLLNSTITEELKVNVEKGAGFWAIEITSILPLDLM